MFQANKSGRYPIIPSVVRIGLPVDVTVGVVAPPGRASLLYDQSAFRSDNAYRVSDGEPAVTFQGCKDHLSSGID